MKLTQSDLLDPAAFSQKFSQPEFGNLAEAVAFADGKPSAGWTVSADRVASRQTGREREKFTLTASWRAAKDLAAAGWDEGREKVAANLADIFTSGAAELSNGAAVEYAVGGAYPDVPLYVAGEVCHMVNDGEQLGEKPIIKFLINASASCNISADSIANRGAAVAALVDQIESGGTRCEIWVTFATRKGGKFYAPMVCAKRAGEPLDIDVVAFTMGHPAMLRRVLFGIVENDPFTDGVRFESGYGSAETVPAAAIPGDVIHLGVLRDQTKYRTPADAMAEVRRLYNEQAEQKGLEVQS